MINKIDKFIYPGTHRETIEGKRHYVDYVEPIKPTFHEHVYIDELKRYIYSTYNQHYAHNGRLQSTEVIIDRGRGLEFCLGNIDKYSNRYGSKGTVDDYRKDLMKIAHYAIIALYCHDKKYSS